MEPPIIFEHGYHVDTPTDCEAIGMPIERPSRPLAELREPADALLTTRSRSALPSITDRAIDAHLRNVAAHRLTSTAQRVVDVAVSAVALFLLFPLLAIVSLLIKLDSRGPILFYQERIGHNGNPFRMFKFRSMVTGAELQQADLWSENEREGPVFKIKNDPRVTRTGRWLRHYSIDEIPQLVNVLRGDMSLVGPRPALPLEVAMYTPYQMRRLDVVPGITGLWQISGRANLSFDQSVELDLQYIRTRTIALNLRILLKTIPVVVKGDGAY